LRKGDALTRFRIPEGERERDRIVVDAGDRSRIGMSIPDVLDPKDAEP